MKRTAIQETPTLVVESKEQEPLEKQMLAEALATFDMFKADEETLTKAIKARDEQMGILRQEQSQDAEKLLRVRGALSAIQHLVTVYKDKMQKAQSVQGD